MSQTNIEFGRNLLPDALPQNMDWLVITTPPIREFVKSQFSSVEAQIHVPVSMDLAQLVDWEQQLPAAGTVLGIGGGVCMDAAKYIAWQRHLELYLVPSIISVDACVTETIGIRREGRVRYIGEVYPRSVLVDFELIQKAPLNLNRAGAGDILSIHTALSDWQLAARETGEFYNERTAQQSAALLEQLDAAAEEIFHVTETGIRTLMALYLAEVQFCQQMGNSRPEEGSEHFWAYNVEYLTGKNFVHGELVALGVLLMAALQDNKLTQIHQLIQKLGVRWRPEAIGLHPEEVQPALVTAKHYVETEGLSWSVLNARPIAPDLGVRIYNSVTALE